MTHETTRMSMKTAKTKLHIYYQTIKKQKGRLGQIIEIEPAV